MTWTSLMRRLQVAAPTFTTAVPVIEPTVALIVAAPAVVRLSTRPLSVPPAPTIATVALVVAHAAVAVRSLVMPPKNVPIALSWTRCCW